MKTPMLLLSLFVFSWQIHAEETKMNVELTAYIPGFGVEYQIDNNQTIGVNYSALNSVNIHTTFYNNNAALAESSSYLNVFLGAGQDKQGLASVLTRDKFIYTGAVYGYQWVLDNNINVNLDGGLMVLFFPESNGAKLLPLPAFALSVGYAFDM